MNQHPAKGLVSLEDAVSENQQYDCRDILSGQNHTHQGLQMAHPGFSLQLEGYQAQIWQIEGKASGAI